MKMRFVYTIDIDTFTGRHIPSVTGGQYSHVIVEFVDEAIPCDVYFESIWKKDPCTGKTGLRGPIPMKNIWDWHADDRRSRFVERQPATGFLPLTESEANQCYATLKEMVPYVKYAKIQLGSNWFGRRVGFYVHYGPGTRMKWTCCETPIRVLPHRILKYFPILDYTADDFSPDGDNGPSLKSCVMAWIDAEGTID